MTSETTETTDRVPKWLIDLNKKKIDLRMKLQESRIRTKALKDELNEADKMMTHEIDESEHGLFTQGEGEAEEEYEYEDE